MLSPSIHCNRSVVSCGEMQLTAKADNHNDFGCYLVYEKSEVHDMNSDQYMSLHEHSSTKRLLNRISGRLGSVVIVFTAQSVFTILYS